MVVLMNVGRECVEWKEHEKVKLKRDCTTGAV